MVVKRFEVNRRSKDDEDMKKSRAPKEPGLRYWPREADTITFQEGLLNCRVTGGGGHMRDTTDQRLSTMIPIGAMQQPSRPHVRHAVSGPSIKSANPQKRDNENVTRASFLAHDLRANASHLSLGKTGFRFSGSHF
jgi:hypothetical protein